MYRGLEEDYNSNYSTEFLSVVEPEDKTKIVKEGESAITIRSIAAGQDSKFISPSLFGC